MDRREYPTASLGSETLASRIYCPMELATDENTLLALPPIRRMVPTTITRITASMTAYSATSCPRSSDHNWRKHFTTGSSLLPAKSSSRERKNCTGLTISEKHPLISVVL